MLGTALGNDNIMTGELDTVPALMELGGTGGAQDGPV